MCVCVCVCEGEKGKKGAEMKSLNYMFAVKSCLEKWLMMCFCYARQALITFFLPAAINAEMFYAVFLIPVFFFKSQQKLDSTSTELFQHKKLSEYIKEST